MSDRKVDPEVEVAIVGAGAAGSVFAAELASAGRKVAVLEAGPAWTLEDLVSSQLWSRRLKWRGAAVAATGDDRIGHNFGTGSGFGGAALHHYGTWPRFSEENFELRTRHGRGLDWPIRYDDLRPWYDRIQAEVGIAGDAAAESWRPPGDPYPMPPLPRFPQADLIGRGFERTGKRVAPLPVIVNTQPYRGRPACLWDGWCDAGCPTGALGNPLVTWFKAARSAGAEFRSGCDVKRIETDSRGRATGVEYVSRGVLHLQPASVVILAASFVGNPRILLNSASRQHPQGLANSSGLVGRYLLAEVAVQGFGLFEQETQPHMGINAGHLTYREGYVAAGRKEAFAGYQWQLGCAMKPNDLFGLGLTRPDLFGQDLHAFMRRSARHIGMMIAFGGGVPLEANRVELDSRRDADGFPMARTVHRFGDDLRSLWRHLRSEAQSVYSAAGATEHWSTPGMVTGHVIGGTLMGKTAGTSVCDGYGRAHEVPNLVLAGAGLFPSSGGTSPTFTIHAVSARSAAHVIQHWGTYAE